MNKATYSSHNSTHNRFFGVIVCSIIFCVFVSSGCGTQFKKSGRQTEYHEETSELEQYVLSSLGDYIWFEKPLLEEDSNRVTLYIYLTADYTYDEDQLEDHPPFLVEEETRSVMNAFLRDNPSYFGDDCYIACYFYYPADGSSLAGPVSYELGYWDNMFDGQYCDQLCTVEFRDCMSPEYIQGEGVRKLVLNHYTDSEDSITLILDVINRLPDLEEVVVDSYNVDRIREECPDLIVSGC